MAQKWRLLGPLRKEEEAGAMDGDYSPDRSAFSAVGFFPARTKNSALAASLGQPVRGTAGTTVQRRRRRCRSGRTNRGDRYVAVKSRRADRISLRLRRIALQSAVGRMALSVAEMALASAGYLSSIAGAPRRQRSCC
jgi:hypothetical protein